MHISPVRWLSAMTEQLISDAMAYSWSLRGWGQHEAHRVATAVAWGRYGEDDARAELATHLAWHAQRAKILTVSCRALAAEMLSEALEAIEDRHHAVLSGMIAAADKRLQDNPRDAQGAAHAAADIARAENVPPDLIAPAFRIAQWRARRRA
jgi:hypothetical protein